MESEKFDLVFSGQILPRQDVEVVKANMAALFKVSMGQIEALFSGKTVVLKRNIDLAAANRYRVAIKKAGARVDMVKTGVTEAVPAKAEKVVAQSDKPAEKDAGAARHESVSVQDASPSKSAESVSVVAVSAAAAPLALDAVGVNLSEKGAVNAPSVAVPDFEVFEAGSDLLLDTERSQFVAKEVDTSALSVREGKGNLLDEGEWMTDLPIVITDLDADLMPAGSYLINDREREPVKRANIADLDLEVAPVGARLEAERGPQAKAPNVDHIQLSD